MTPHITTIPDGFCNCGCGNRTNIIKQTTRYCDKSRGAGVYKKGEYFKFLMGHSNRIRPILEEAKPFKIDGIPCRLVPLTQGQYALIFESDYVQVMCWKWTARWNKGTKTFYVVRSHTIDGKKVTLLLHQFIAPNPERKEVDHINKITLDNRRSNLRPATRRENGCNRGPQADNTTGYKGVQKARGCKNIWLTKIDHEIVARSRSAEEAAHRYDEEAKKRHGEFAWLNFPDHVESPSN